MEANLTSAALCSHRAGLKMLDQGYGRIINIASVLGVVGGVPEDYSYAYSISKHGMVGLTKALALQWAKKGITANAIGPAYFETELTEFLSEEFAGLAERTPMGRMGKPGGAKDRAALPRRRDLQLHHRPDNSRGWGLDGLVMEITVERNRNTPVR